MDACSLIKGPLSDTVRSMAVKTDENGIEYGFPLFIHNGIMKRTGIQRGNSSSILIETAEKHGLADEPVGDIIATVHTHPDGKFENLFSIQDIKSMIDSGSLFSAVSYVDEGRVFVKVFDTKNFSSFDNFVKYMFNTHYMGMKSVGAVDFIRRSNDELLSCEVRL